MSADGLMQPLQHCALCSCGHEVKWFGRLGFVFHRNTGVAELVAQKPNPFVSRRFR